MVDCDATCWHTLDPQTRLITSDAGQELIDAGVYTPENIADAGALILASEYFVKDVNSFAGLAARRVPVGILGQVTNGKPERSARYRDLLAPSGIPFELRAAFVSRGRCWGAVHIARRDDKRDFTTEDANALTRITGAIAEGLRTTLRLDAARHPTERASPGLVVLAANNDVELITPPAHKCSSRCATRRRPPMTRRRPRHCSHLPRSPAATHRILNAPMRSRSRPASGWITLHASLPDGGSAGRVAIVLERTPSPQSTAIRLEAHGVTPREREIATLLARGLTNRRSPHGSCCPRTPCRITSRTCSRRPACLHARNSSPACSSTNTSPSSCNEPRSHPAAASAGTPTKPVERRPGHVEGRRAPEEMDRHPALPLT